MIKFSKESFATGIYSLAIRCLFTVAVFKVREGDGLIREYVLPMKGFNRKKII